MYNEIILVCGYFFVSFWSCVCFVYVLFIVLFIDWEVVFMGLDCVWEFLYVWILFIVFVLLFFVLFRNFIFCDFVNLLLMWWCCFGEICIFFDDDIIFWFFRILVFMKGFVVVFLIRGLYLRELKLVNLFEGFEMFGSFGYGNKIKECWYMVWFCKLFYMVFFWGFIFNKLINKICVLYYRFLIWFNI